MTFLREVVSTRILGRLNTPISDFVKPVARTRSGGIAMPRDFARHGVFRQTE
jgi:hypothetical protein